MEKWKILLGKSRDGALMQDKDLGELYSFLKLFRNTYKVCEQEADKLLEEIRELYMLHTGVTDAEEALKELRNPRNAGRKTRIREETGVRVKELRRSGRTIREISAETGLSKSSVQRILQKPVSHN